MSVWATYGNALRLILRGDTAIPRDPKQIRLLRRMFARGRRDDDGVYRKDREIPGVETQKRDGDMFYRVPDLALFMVKAFGDEWDSQSPPLALDYLNSLRDAEGLPFLFGSAPSVRAWNETAVGKRHWELVCKEMEIKQELAVQRGMHHAGDPGRWCKIRDNIQNLKNELEAVHSELRDIDKCRWRPQSRGRLEDFLPGFPLGRVDETAEVIKAAAGVLFESNLVFPTGQQVWLKIREADLQGYDIETKGFGKNELVMISDKNMTRAAFTKRWRRYTGE